MCVTHKSFPLFQLCHPLIFRMCDPFRIECDNHYKAIEKLKYAKAYVSETFVTTYFEYLVIKLSMSQSVSQSMSY